MEMKEILIDKVVVNMGVGNVPDEMKKWHYVEKIARDVFWHYGFSEIRTPLFEQTELFVRGIGSNTDIVEKEMYTFKE